jgi:hypothetical protein
MNQGYDTILLFAGVFAIAWPSDYLCTGKECLEYAGHDEV